MARGTTLGTMVTMLRNEIFTSTNSAHGVSQEPMYKHLLARHQEKLWNEFEWPHMRGFLDKALAAGQRYYDFPSLVQYDRIKAVWVRNGSQWVPLVRGVGPEQWSIYDSDDDDARSDPARRWDLYTGSSSDQFEIWPLPASNAVASTLEGYVRFAAIKQLGGLVSESDTADLDDQLIVLSAALEILSGKKNDATRAKAIRFADLKKSLQGNSRTQRPMISIGSEGAGSSAVHSSSRSGRHWSYTDRGIPYSEFRW